MIFSACLACVAQAQESPRFEDYRVSERFSGQPAKPILVTREQRLYRTRITQGALRGDRIVADGKSGRLIEKPGANFAGHYVVIQWGCGSQCVMMAIVDLKTGNVYPPPLSGGSELNLPLDNLSDMETDFRPDSSLMVLRNACRNFRGECGTYYFNWSHDRFALLKLMQ